jgi:hypothetical protein
VGEIPTEPGLQFQRGIFIVPAASGFVNEWGLNLLWVTISRLLPGLWGRKSRNKQGPVWLDSPLRLCEPQRRASLPSIILLYGK